jgi:hypothetical protein
MTWRAPSISPYPEKLRLGAPGAKRRGDGLGGRGAGSLRRIKSLASWGASWGWRHCGLSHDKVVEIEALPRSPRT